MWVVAEYKPVSLFSFRSVIATSSGAKTLLLPTPFAIRTALIDAAIRTKSLAFAKEMFSWLKGVPIAVKPPERVVVTNLFTKILKPTRKEDAESVMDKTIAFREYAYVDGILGLAFEVTVEYMDTLSFLLTQINYLGKRGSFFQLLSQPQMEENLSEDFILLDGACIQNSKVESKWPKSFKVGIIQVVDDWGKDLTFEKLNVYSGEKIKLEKDRLRKNVILPYRVVRSSKGFSYYERI